MQSSSFTLHERQRPLPHGMSSLANGSRQVVTRTTADDAHPSHGLRDHRSGTSIPMTNKEPMGTPYTDWAPSGPVVTPWIPMPLPPPQMPLPTTMYELFVQPPPFPIPGAPALAPTEMLYNGNTFLCWFAFPCGVPLRSTSAESIRQHLAQFHTADVDMQDGRTRTRCQWWTRHGWCESEVFCEGLPKHIAGVHLKTECACELCGLLVSRPDALKRHVACVHLKDTTGSHPCPRCGLKVSRRDVLKRHMESCPNR